MHRREPRSPYRVGALKERQAHPHHVSAICAHEQARQSCTELRPKERRLCCARTAEHPCGDVIVVDGLEVLGHDLGLEAEEPLAGLLLLRLDLLHTPNT